MSCVVIQSTQHVTASLGWCLWFVHWLQAEKNMSANEQTWMFDVWEYRTNWLYKCFTWAEMQTKLACQVFRIYAASLMRNSECKHNCIDYKKTQGSFNIHYIWQTTIFLDNNKFLCDKSLGKALFHSNMTVYPCTKTGPRGNVALCGKILVACSEPWPHPNPASLVWTPNKALSPMISVGPL